MQFIREQQQLLIEFQQLQFVFVIIPLIEFLLFVILFFEQQLQFMFKQPLVVFVQFLKLVILLFITQQL